MTPSPTRRTVTRILLLSPLFVLAGLFLSTGTALAAETPTTAVSTAGQLPSADPTADATPDGPTGPAGPSGPEVQLGGDDVSVELKDLTSKPGTSVTVLLGMTLLSLLPAILLTCTSFTKILVVLGLTRNALGLQSTPPNQVLTGLALFLSLFIMSPVLSQMNDDGVKPYMDGTKTAHQAWDDGIVPLRDFMLKHTDDDELKLLTDVAHRDLPKSRDDVSMATLVPAFVLSELKQAFIIGFIIFIPFLIIDIVVSGTLMALGMMMMPPTTVALPFKLLLFVMVDGWGLIIKSIVQSYGTG